MLPLPQNRSSAVGISATFLATCTEPMTGWTLQATLENGSGATIATKTVGAGITIADGANGTDTLATIDFASDGTSKALAAGTYTLYVWRLDNGAEDLLAKVTWTFTQE